MKVKDRDKSFILRKIKNIMLHSPINKLPEEVQAHLPKQAQQIYKESYNNAWKEFEDSDDREGSESREDVAHKMAWNAVKNEYKKSDDGRWQKKK